MNISQVNKWMKREKAFLGREDSRGGRQGWEAGEAGLMAGAARGGRMKSER